MGFVDPVKRATTMDEPQISDYALIGDSRAAALVSRYGSIDWCCLPEFDSPAIFAALLDRSRGGYFTIHPAAACKSAQQYLVDTNVSETIFVTDSGRVSLTEGFAVRDEKEKQLALYPDHEILRVLEGISGSVRMTMQYVPRIYYGRSPALLVDREKLGISFTRKEGIFTLLTTLPTDQLTLVDTGKVEAAFEVKRGERIYFSLSYCDQAPAIIPELIHTASSRMERTLSYWRDWIRKCKYEGLYAEHVRRSALVLKLLTHAPSGSIIAAATTSLPEQLGSERNWDYRYCWLRDASFTTRVLLKLGFEDEVKAYMNWILHATRLTRPRLQVVYSTYGHARLREQTLDWLSGYRNSVPVRIGNGADDQFQLDVYGEVLDAIYLCCQLVEKFDKDSRSFIIGLGKVICKIWDQPDNGIWEIRSRELHHTHSKVMAWVGLDRVIKICEKYSWEGAPLAMFEDTRKRIHSLVEASGYNPEIGSYTREIGGSDVDASALAFSLVGYTDFNSDRMKSTTRAVGKYLSRNNMIIRYNAVDDGIKGEEGAFTTCNFWFIENLARSGSLEKAKQMFEDTVRCMSGSGLLSEEIDPMTGALLGNFPQAFTHIGLVNAAIAINEEHTKQHETHNHTVERE